MAIRLLRRSIRAHRRLITGLLVALAAAWIPASATADGDPGSDVLVYQSLFVASDAGLSTGQQVALTAMLSQARRAGVPVRVAIIAHRDDLGAITGLWRKPRAYARFLGYELSLSFKGRLLVVMPDGVGVDWVGHSTTAAYRSLAGVTVGPGGSGLAAAARSGVGRLAAADGVTLRAGTASHDTGSNPRATPAPAALPRASAPASGGGVPGPLIVLLVIAALVVLGIVGFPVLRRRTRVRRGRLAEAWRSSVSRAIAPRRRAVTAAAVLMTGAAVAAGAVTVLSVSAGSSSANPLATNPELDPGTPLKGQLAPNFTLTDQSGRRVSLAAFRGKVVILDFTDSECTTICPLTTTAMLDAKRMLGRAGSRVQLIGVDADPKATSIQDVQSYSELHGMLGRWRFLTGSLPALRHVWSRYHVTADVQRGLISHTPALYVIDPEGRERALYVTQQSYSAVGQLGQLLAGEASHLLPGHPRVDSHLPYTPVATITPTRAATLPTTTGRTVRLGPSRSPHLFLFFATWDQEVTSLGGQLQALNRYRSAAAAPGARLPALTAVDEGSVEPSPSALPRFLGRLAHPPSYPIAIDRTGRVADGYDVQGQPWFVLTSARGQILWYWDVNTRGWLSRAALTTDVRAALARTPAAPAGATAVRRELAGSPPPLAALHRQAGRVLGSEAALSARIHSLRGYPIVVNAWASWCDPCRQEAKLFAAASARYGRRVAFLGADTDDSAGDAQSFLHQHPVSYPSYQSTTSQLDGIIPGGPEGLPITVFLSPAGKVLEVHTGQYDSQGTLDADIQRNALDGH